MKRKIFRFVPDVIKEERDREKKRAEGGRKKQLVHIAFITIRVITTARDKKQEQS